MRFRSANWNAGTRAQSSRYREDKLISGAPNRREKHPSQDENLQIIQKYDKMNRLIKVSMESVITI